ncbi:MAG: transrane protein [Myxococcaceae bacterium]|nr:transrane protein [Myxococcaceae bacterium]
MKRASDSERDTDRLDGGSSLIKSSALATIQAVHDVVRPLLTTAIQIVQMKRERRPPPELAYQQLRKLLDEVTRKLEKLKLGPDAVQNIRYALVAAVDELMQTEPGPIKEFWRSHLLQLELFGETLAGEGFFERLESLKHEGQYVELHVYYVLLLLGFHGIYGQHGELERENLIESVRGRLLSAGVLVNKPVLAPHGLRPDEPGIDRARNRLLQWLAAAAAVLSIVWYFGLLFTVDAQAHNLSEQIRALYDDLEANLSVSSSVH